MLIHQRLQHQNIVSLLTTISYQGRLGLVLEFCESGSLEQLLKAHGAWFLPESVARRYTLHLHAALEFVHLSGETINSQNILKGHSGRVRNRKSDDEFCKGYI